MINTKMFQQEMKSKGYTIEKLASEIGRSRTCLFNKIHNHTEFRLSEIDLVCDKLKLSKPKRLAIFFARCVE